MCGRYRLARKKEILAEVFDVGDVDHWSPRYNIAPSQSVPVVRQDSPRPVRSFSLIRWGLIPFWTLLAKYHMTCRPSCMPPAVATTHASLGIGFCPKVKPRLHLF